MNVLSMCDGMSCLQIAMTELEIPVDNYYVAEIYDKAIQVTQDNFPKTVQLGDLTKITIDDILKMPKIDIVAFGFPCRSNSKANYGKEKYNQGLRGVSGIFYDCLKVLRMIQEHNNADVKFIVENVDGMSAEDRQEVTKQLGCEYKEIDSADFGPQCRKRLWWCNFEILPYPKFNCSTLADVMDKDVDESYYYKQTFDYYGEEHKAVCAILHIKGNDILKRVNSKYYKCPTLISVRGGNNQKKVYDNGRCRKLTPTEYRRLQHIPHWYKMNVAKSHIYNMCGDGWDIAVIKHILKSLTNPLT